MYTFNRTSSVIVYAPHRDIQVHVDPKMCTKIHQERKLMARNKHAANIALALAISIVVALLLGCSSEPGTVEIVEVEKEVIVEKEVVKEVPVEKIVTREIIREVEVPGQTVIKEVSVERVVTKEVPVETIVTKEVVKEVPVQTIVTREVAVEKEVVKIVEVQGKHGGSLVDARTTDATSLDPHNVPAAANFRIRGHIYSGLVALDSGMSVQPDLATSWEIPDPTTYVFHLREGVTFHNGEPLSAEDVKYTYERILEEGTGSFIIPIRRDCAANLMAHPPSSVVPAKAGTQ